MDETEKGSEGGGSEERKRDGGCWSKKQMRNVTEGDWQEGRKEGGRKYREREREREETSS